MIVSRQLASTFLVVAGASQEIDASVQWVRCQCLEVVTCRYLYRSVSPGRKKWSASQRRVGRYTDGQISLEILDERVATSPTTTHTQSL